MSKALSFQQVIMTLHQFWADQGCMLWRPYNTQVGAGTNNPATLLRVLGPEPWRVAYQEPSIRPDDGRYGENPNRMQMHTQYQVILKPDPGNPQEIYLRSLEAIGISQREHDIRFVEDNWESPALGAWGLGWEVWLDGQEITQFTYFQQAGGLELDPVAVELTYGLDRITLALQHKNKVWDVEWTDGLLYGEVLLRQEIEHCMYYFDIADVDGLRKEFTFYEQEFGRALENGAVMPAYDYVLKCSHTFNVLDTRGAIGVTERANYFRKMRDMTRQVAKAYAAQREEMGYPLKSVERWNAPALPAVGSMPPAPVKAADFLLEIGIEELPAGDVDDAIAQLQKIAETLFDDLRLSHEGVSVMGTPRRLVISAKNIAPRQTDRESIEKGPPADRAYDKDGKPTKAAEGFARSRGVNIDDLQIVEEGGGRYVAAHVREVGRAATEVLAEALPNVISSIKFGKTMRWNSTNVAFSRPLRWIVALFGDVVIPFSYAGAASGRVTRGLRPYGSPETEVADVAAYFNALNAQGIVLSREERRQRILEQILKLADEVGGRIPDDEKLLDEVTNLIESPTALRGTFDAQSLELPREVLITVMRKHQRYFAVEGSDGKLMPYFIAVRNGDAEHLDIVIDGNEHVLRARFSDAAFFYTTDRQKALHDFLPRLSTLTFQEKLGSMLDKNERVASVIEGMGKLLGTGDTDVAIAQRAAHIAKADLATQMVVELTSLQGVMGKVYAGLSGYPQEVADAVFEHWLPRGADDILPQSAAGVLLALTDKLDSLVGLFGVGLAPKSSADPYGLRRAALGVIQILVDQSIDLPLRRAVDLVAASQPVSVSDEAREQVVTFIAGRLEAWLLEQGTAQTDVIQAVLAQQSGNPARAVVGVRELSEWVKRSDWEAVLDSFARCVRITRPVAEHYEVNPTALVEPQEKALYEAYQTASGQLNASGNVDAFLSAFTPMLPAVTAFFDNVLVNAEDEQVKRNRLGLLQAIGAMAHGRADLSNLSGF